MILNKTLESEMSKLIQVCRVMIAAFTLCSSVFAIPAPRLELPPGSYLQTCQQCRVSADGNLTCMCKDRQQNLTKTAISLNEGCDVFKNIDGALQCAERDTPEHRSHRASTFIVQAGPIWNGDDANEKCPTTCEMNNANWTGSWTTTEVGSMSVCKCIR
jgi:hypothetical protein